MIWVLIVGLLWASLALPVALVIGRGLRMGDAGTPGGLRVDDAWTDEVAQFLREHGLPSDSSGPAVTST